MVGVPGRSRGCATCRKRKKGCDQQRPVCGQCRHSKLVCQGYPKSLTFVQYNPSSDGPSNFETDQNDSSSDPYSTAICIVATPLMKSAVDIYMFDNYWDGFFPKANPKDMRWVPSGEIPSRWIPAAWIYEIRDLCATDVLIKTAMQANAYSTTGKRKAEKRLDVAGMQAYSLALQEVHNNLKDIRKMKSDTVLAGCKLLALYEAQQGAGVNWERHAMGILRLLQVRGAEKHQFGIAHSLFLDARYQGVVASIRRREPTFLSDPEWCTVPWELESKGYRHELIDIMTLLPHAQFEHDELAATLMGKSDLSERHRNYFHLCGKIRTDLEAWMANLKLTFDIDRIGLLDDGIPENFPLSNIMLAHVMTLYWASLLLLNMLILQGFSKFRVANNPLEAEDFSSFEITPLIMNIAKSIPFFFQPDAGSICPQTFSFPLGVALNIASHTNVKDVPEYHRLLRAFSKGPMGDMIRKFLVSLKLVADPGLTHDGGGGDESGAATYEEMKDIAHMYHEKAIT